MEALTAENKKSPSTSNSEMENISPTPPMEEVSEVVPGRVPFFRSTLFQILVVGVCAFSAPGIWSAMNGLGVGGSQSPDLVNAANAILYGIMTLTCFAGPWMTNLIGFRWTLALGTLGCK